MSGRDYQLPVGDRDFDDERGAKPKRYEWPDLPSNLPPRQEREGLGTYLARLEAEGALVPKAVPVYDCVECHEDFNHEPLVPEDMHVDEAKKKGWTWCSARCFEKSAEHQWSRRQEELVNR